jgi:predicted O-linked N-acetylglucosamine transferase (SPINDLY family)
MQIDIQSARKNLRLKNFEMAISQYQVLIAESPANFIFYLELSSALMGLYKFDEALVVVKQIENMDPALDGEIKLQKANIFVLQGRLSEALPILLQLLSSPCGDRARTTLSGLYIQRGLPSKAVSLFDGLDREKLTVGDIDNLAIALCEGMQAKEALSILSERIIKNNYELSTISNLLMLSNYVLETEKYISIAKDAIVKNFGNDLIDASSSLTQKSLRLGFVSGDMNQHPVGWFFIGLLRELTKKYSVNIYYTSQKSDQLTRDLAEAASTFSFVDDLADQDLATKIRADQIDILFDLSGHTAKNKIAIFSQRIAPVQLSYLGYFSSTYMPQIDGAIFDERHMSGVPDTFFSERVYKLPCSRFCYAPPPYATQIAPLPALTNDCIIFCSFSSTSKVSDLCIEMWAKTLIAIPNSRIKLRWRTLRDTHLCDYIKGQFLLHGVVNSRVELYPDCDHESLFYFYNEVDIALDTYPFSGATTTCEALWMGVPVITRLGSTPASNQAASILGEIGLDECISSSIDEFVAKAESLSSDKNRLSSLRSSMRGRVLGSSLGDPVVFAKHFSRLIEDIQR